MLDEKGSSHLAQNEAFVGRNKVDGFDKIHKLVFLSDKWEEKRQSDVGEGYDSSITPVLWKVHRFLSFSPSEARTVPTERDVHQK